MANQQHLDLLINGGIKAWNDYVEKERIKDNNFLRADLSGVDLSGVDLSGAILKRADLSGAKLSGSNLSGAKLYSANLSAARLSGADLSGADLIGVIFTETDLSGADLSRSQLMLASFLKADLDDADFKSAIIGWTIFANVNLKRVKNLEMVQHAMPSSIGIDTIFCSEGKIPEKFLRDAGVPQYLTDYIPSFIGMPWEYYSCFISYSSKNQDIADRLHSDLQKIGVRCWLATEDLKIGDRFRNEIDKAIKFFDKLLLILSETSVTSEWVEDEV